MSVITVLALKKGNNEKRVEITDVPKKVKHLTVFARRHFGEVAIDCHYVVNPGKIDQIELKDGEMSLINLYKGKTKVEIY